MSDSSLDLSVIIAIYNEEQVIESTISRILTELLKINCTWELICIDDGSIDRSFEIIQNCAREDLRIKIVRHRRNFGQGRALKTAFSIANGDIWITLDADLSYGSEYIPRLLTTIRESNSDIVLASAYMKGGSVQNVPFHRHLLSRVANWYLARMSPYPVSTGTCVVRAYRHEVIDSLILSSDGMELQIEILMKAHLEGFRVCEIPATLRWDNSDKNLENKSRRSKMKVFRAINIYFLLGWLAKPAFLFIVFSLLLIIPGLYMLLILSLRVIESIPNHINAGLISAVSLSLQSVFSQYTYSFIIYGGMLLIGLQILLYSFILIQNKHQYEDLFKALQAIKRRDIFDE